MASREDFERTATSLAALNRNELTRRIKNFKGKTEIISYECRGKTAAQVKSNAEEVFRKAGYTIDFTGYDMPEHFVTGHKGAQWLAVVANESGDDSDYRVVSVLKSTP